MIFIAASDNGIFEKQISEPKFEVLQMLLRSEYRPSEISVDAEAFLFIKFTKSILG